MVDTIVQALGGQALIEKAIHNNLKWLNKSFSKNQFLGSSAYANIFGQWSSPYPETTGYLIPTILRAGKQLGDSYWTELAKKQIEYFEMILDAEGGFLSRDNKPPLVFDSSQILLGICALKNNGHLQNGNKKLLSSYYWIISKLNSDGCFEDYNFIDDYNPSYYSRIAWALLETEHTFGLEPKTEVSALFNRIKNLQSDNYNFNVAAFGPDEPVFTHTLLYTIRGLWESALKLRDNETLHKMHKTVLYIDDLILENKQQFAGSYETNWHGDYSFVCTVGHCQLVYIKLLMYKKTGDERFLRNVGSLLRIVMKAQRKLGFNAGAIPSSLPVWGSYQRFRYTNWTQKFFLDCLLELQG